MNLSIEKTYLAIGSKGMVKGGSDSINTLKVRLESRFKREVSKGVWGMPRLSEAKKDVISCDKLWVGANNR